MKKPSWIRSHHCKARKRWDRQVPDLARFPDLPPVGYEQETLAELRAMRDRLSPKGN